MEEEKLEGGSAPVICPKCQSENVEPEAMFDYVKTCQDCGYQFSTGIHN